MYVNELAKTAGVKPHVVRYYTRIGLLQPDRSPDNGYKRYGKPEMQRLREIQWLQQLGFSLSEIQDLLAQDIASPHGSAALLSGLKRNIARNRQRIDDLLRLQRHMETTLERWEGDQCPRLPDAATI